MNAASELTGAADAKAAGKGSTSMDAEMDIKLPGGGTLGAGGEKATDAPAGVVVRTSRESFSSPLVAC